MIGVVMPPGMTSAVAEIQEAVGSEPLGGGIQWSGGFLVHTQWEIEAIKAVLQIRQLGEDWDSYGSPAVNNTAIDGAVSLLRNMARMGFDIPLPKIVPIPGGGIQIEWDIEGRELEFAVLPDGCVEFLRSKGGEPIEEGAVRGWNYFQMRSFFGWLMASGPGKAK